MDNNRRLSLIVLLLSSLCTLTWQTSVSSTSYYTAGVVEFRPAMFTIKNEKEQVDDNLQGFIEIITSDAAIPTDIIIFPENSLNNVKQLTYVPNPTEELIVPCDEADTNIYHEFLVQISCQARNVSKYIVINISEQEDCSLSKNDPRSCAENGLNIFNTNVVFDRTGAVISRYRKVHLYGEAKNTTYEPEYGIFETDFDVKFGHFVCFDILFYTPTQEMIDEMGIRDFIFPTMWFSQLPFLTGVQFQAAWSYANDVNLLAAGASHPPVGTTGTGIYHGRRGALKAVMNLNKGQRSLYVSNVPKYKSVRSVSKRDISSAKRVKRPISRLSQDDIYLKRDYLEHYNSILLDLSKTTNIQEKLCFSSTFCCHFDLKWKHLELVSNSTYYKYRLGAFEGWRTEEAAETNQIKNCALFTCISDDIIDCGKIFPKNETDILPQVTFERVFIEALYPKVSKYTLMPNSLKDDLLPIPVGNFEWNVTNEGSANKVSFLLNTTTENLLTFAIYGNYFDGDGASTITLSCALIICTISSITFLKGVIEYF